MTSVKSDDPGHHADGTVHSHRFAAANTAVPFVNHDAAQLRGDRGVPEVRLHQRRHLRGRRRLTRRARHADGPARRRGAAGAVELRRRRGGRAVAQPVIIRDVGQVAAPIDKAPPPLAPGSTARVDVVVRTRKIGHFFPGGTVDAFDIWLELQGRDADGPDRLLERPGAANDGKGPVETGAHFYRSYQLDGDGNPINKRNAWQARSVLYVRLIPPGAADVAHYRVRIPKDAQGPITLTAKLNYRKFAHYYTQFAYAGSRSRDRIRRADRAGHSTTCEYSFDPANIPKNVSSRSRIGFRICRSSCWREATATRAARRRQDADRVDAGRARRRTASAGTTGASACCCRAISRAPSTRSSR